MRRELVAGLVGFVGGFVGALVTFGWLIVQFVPADAHWWDLLHTCINALIISFIFGGLGFAALSVWTFSWYHHLRGYYRCRFCNRPLKSATARCDCPEVKALG
jgi:hypothetical protein